MPSGVRMEAQAEKESLAGDVMESMGEPRESGTELNQSHESEGASNENTIDHAKALASVKKRMKAMSMNHERELRDMQARMAEMQSNRAPEPSYGSNNGQYNAQVQPGSVDEQIHKAVSFALQHKEMQEQKAREAQNQAHVQKKYKELYKHLDNMGDKYDDFHDTVFGEEAQFTPSMRDYAVTLPKSGKGSAGEVLYNLGKNPEELNRISQLHPADQAEEMARLSHALIAGGSEKAQSQSRPLGQVKTNPVSHSNASVTDKTPIGSIRARMKSGTFK